MVCPDPVALKKMMNVVSDCDGNGVAWHTQSWDGRDGRLHRLPLQLMQWEPSEDAEWVQAHLASLRNALSVLFMPENVSGQSYI